MTPAVCGRKCKGAASLLEFYFRARALLLPASGAGPAGSRRGSGSLLRRIKSSLKWKLISLIVVIIVSMMAMIGLFQLLRHIADDPSGCCTFQLAGAAPGESKFEPAISGIRARVSRARNKP